MNARTSIKRGYSQATDAREAVKELSQMIHQPDSAITMFFTSTEHDLNVLAVEMQNAFQGLTVGCTTAGEISPLGYSKGSLSGFSIASRELQVFPYLISPLRKFDTVQVKGIVESIQQRMAQVRKEKPETGFFGLLFIDGLSLMEERVVAILSDAASEIPIIGGSAGDDLKLKQTHIFFDGKFITDAALFCLFATTLPFRPIKTQHFTATDERLVITKAAPEKRIVYEINGRPAAEEYARVIGMNLMQLKHLIYFTKPVMLRVGGEYYVRSIQSVNEDGSLTFFSAIDEGLVLRIAHREDLVGNLQTAFENIKGEFKEIQLTIGCDCILRRLEVEDKGLEGQVNEILQKNNVIGFSTYGEQFKSVHFNQTFTGIVLGE